MTTYSASISPTNMTPAAWPALQAALDGSMRSLFFYNSNRLS